MESILQLGCRQRRILELVWERGEADVESVRRALGDDGVELAYTTVLTVMQTLERRGWLRHRRSGRRYRYSAAIPRHRALRDALAFAERILGVHARRAIQKPISMHERLARRRRAS